MRDDDLPAIERGAAALDQASRAHDEPAWPEPLDIFREFAAPPFTADDVPPIIGDYARLFAASAGFDLTTVLLPMVAAASASVDDGVRLLVRSPTGWFESARLWVLTLGGPASGKTPAQRAALAPLYATASELVAQWKAENPDPKDENAPPCPRLMTHDATIEKLAEILAGNPRGLLYVAEEFDSWIGSHDAYRNGQGSRDRGEWLRAYDGGPHTVDRMSRGSAFVDNWGIGIVASTTPAALKRHARNLPVDGLLARFIVGCSAHRPRPDAAILRAEVERARRRYEDRLRELLLDHGSAGGTVVALSGPARELFDAEEQRLLDATEAAEALSPPFAAHLGKHPGLVARLALTFHAVETAGHPTSCDVTGETMQRACRFARRARRHALAMTADLFSNTKDAAKVARALARAVLASARGAINKREARAICSEFRGADERDQLAALSALVDSGWLRPEFATQVPPHGAVWTVNPRTHERFAQVGAEHAKRRAAVRDVLAGGGARDDD